MGVTPWERSNELNTRWTLNSFDKKCWVYSPSSSELPKSVLALGMTLVRRWLQLCTGWWCGGAECPRWRGWARDTINIFSSPSTLQAELSFSERPTGTSLQALLSLMKLQPLYSSFVFLRSWNLGNYCFFLHWDGYSSRAEETEGSFARLPWFNPRIISLAWGLSQTRWIFVIAGVSRQILVLEGENQAMTCGG